MHSVVLLFVYSSICILVTGLPYSDESGSEDILRDDELLLSSKREKRSSGIIRSILSSARLNPKFQSRGYRYFRKRGNHKDAVKDFNRLKPTGVIRDGPRIRGTAGDLSIELHKGEKRSDLVIHSGHGGNKETVIIEYIPR